jgi:hypothetical protein
MCLRKTGFIIRSADSLLPSPPFRGRRELLAADEEITINAIKLLTRSLAKETI